MDSELQGELDFIKDVLTGLFKQPGAGAPESHRLWSDVRVRQLYIALRPFSDVGHLEKLLPSESRPNNGFSEERVFLYLEPVEKGSALPILSMKWELNPKEGKPKTMRFRFFLFHWADGERRPRAIGFRLESPEGPGAHNFWHAQMISEFEKGDESLQGVVEIPFWVPTSQPSFPLPVNSVHAERFGDLLAVLLLSLYGATQLGTIGRKLSSPTFGSLKKRLETAGISLR